MREQELVKFPGRTKVIGQPLKTLNCLSLTRYACLVCGSPDFSNDIRRKVLEAMEEFELEFAETEFQPPEFKAYPIEAHPSPQKEKDIELGLLSSKQQVKEIPEKSSKPTNQHHVGSRIQPSLSSINKQRLARVNGEIKGIEEGREASPELETRSLGARVNAREII